MTAGVSSSAAPAAITLGRLLLIALVGGILRLRGKGNTIVGVSETFGAAPGIG